MQKKKILAFILALMAMGGAGTYYYVNAHPEKDTIFFVSGTEYGAGDTAQTIVRVTNALGIAVTATWCNVSIIYPNRTDNVTTNTSMTQNGLDGSWVYNWTAPTEYGLYEQYAECLVGSTKIANSKASHVGETITNINTSLGGGNPQVNVLS